MLVVFENVKASGTITLVQIGLSGKQVLVMLANIYCVQIKLLEYLCTSIEVTLVIMKLLFFYNTNAINVRFSQFILCW